MLTSLDRLDLITLNIFLFQKLYLPPLKGGRVITTISEFAIRFGSILR